MNRRGVLCEEVYHVLQFPSPALSVSGNMGIISACGTYCIGTWQAPLCIRGAKIGKIRELYQMEKTAANHFGAVSTPQFSINYVVIIYCGYLSVYLLFNSGVPIALHPVQRSVPAVFLTSQMGIQVG